MLMICSAHILCRCGTTSTLYSNEKCVFVLLRFGSIKCAKRTCKCNHWIRVPLHPAMGERKRGEARISWLRICICRFGLRVECRQSVVGENEKTQNKNTENGVNTHEMWKNVRNRICQPKTTCVRRNPPSNLIHSYYAIMSEVGIFFCCCCCVGPPVLYAFILTATEEKKKKTTQTDYISFTITNVSHLNGVR